MSDCTHHCTPRALSMGRISLLRSSSLIPLARCSLGMASITSLLFDMNLWRLKPPLASKLFVLFIRAEASVAEGADFSPSST